MSDKQPILFRRAFGALRPATPAAEESRDRYTRDPSYRLRKVNASRRARGAPEAKNIDEICAKGQTIQPVVHHRGTPLRPRQSETAAQVANELLHYDPQSGKLTWKERGPEWFPSGKGCAAWNNRYAGTEALAHVNTGGYLCGALLRKHITAHRAAWMIAHGTVPLEIDHINGDRKDNRLANLREVDRRTNSMNRKLRCDSRHGCPGIDFWRGKWRARMFADGKESWCALFDTKDDAIIARYERQASMGYTDRHGKPQ